MSNDIYSISHEYSENILKLSTLFDVHLSYRDQKYAYLEEYAMVVMKAIFKKVFATYQARNLVNMTIIKARKAKRL